MTQEQINELRIAISEILIPHEWRAESVAQAITEVFVDADGGQWAIASTQDLPKCLCPADANYPVFRHSQRDAIARYIAAANPAAILALIQQRDELLRIASDAATSLETINCRSFGDDSNLNHPDQMRAYAGSRAGVVRKEIKDAGIES